MSSLSRTIILITGANQGLGFECVKKLAAEQSNYHILLGSRNASKGKAAAESVTTRASNTVVTPLELDINSDSSIASAVSTITNTHGRLDILFNNAGILYPPKESSLREELTTIFTTNVFSTCVLTEALVPLLQKSDFPRIVFMTSTLGSLTKTADPNIEWGGMYMAYSASKSALNMIAVKIYGKYKKLGFKVNVVCPGHRSTNLNDYSSGGGEAEGGALEACRIITQGKDGQNMTFTEDPGRIIPW